LAGRKRDLALFNLAIDSKLRGCDLVSLRLSDITPRGYAVDRATIRQHKTGRPVRFELTEQTREAVDDYLKSVPTEAGGVTRSCVLRPRVCGATTSRRSRQQTDRLPRS